MPRALHAVAAEFAFRQRSSQVGAGLSQGKDVLAAANDQNRDSVMLGAFEFPFRQLRFWKDRLKIVRKFLTAGVVQTDLLLIYQIPTQIGSCRCYRISQYREAASRRA